MKETNVLKQILEDYRDYLINKYDFQKSGFNINLKSQPPTIAIDGNFYTLFNYKANANKEFSKLKKVLQREGYWIEFYNNSLWHIHSKEDEYLKWRDEYVAKHIRMYWDFTNIFTINLLSEKHNTLIAKELQDRFPTSEKMYYNEEIGEEIATNEKELYEYLRSIYYSPWETGKRFARKVKGTKRERFNKARKKCFLKFKEKKKRRKCVGGINYELQKEKETDGIKESN